MAGDLLAKVYEASPLLLAARRKVETLRQRLDTHNEVNRLLIADGPRGEADLPEPSSLDPQQLLRERAGTWQELQEAEAEFGRIWRETASTSGELAALEGGPLPSPGVVQGVLLPGDCYLGLLWDDEEGLACVILPKRGSLSVRAVKGQAFAELRQQLARVFDNHLPVGPAHTWQLGGIGSGNLRRTPAGTRRLVISPHSKLTAFPFHLLPVQVAGVPAPRRLPSAIVAAVSSLVRTRNTPDRDWDGAYIAVAYNPGPQRGNIPGVEVEVRQCHSYYFPRAAGPFTGDRAKEILTCEESARVVHLACHASLMDSSSAREEMAGVPQRTSCS
ncbi:MAG: CHAT domain-containing protein [Dehalococcoidia bacterium]|uniref:CHAT domain-containing protein n=1 Tax=Candidatus Amarobacter glycogenicus TaxID=3140699 RepID=UPI003135CD90|nr:CHAT domain-containing protein [Dehalococcoidia bacterium]